MAVAKASTSSIVVSHEHTHVDDLARAVTAACTGPIENGSRLDLTAAGYSTP